MLPFPPYLSCFFISMFALCHYTIIYIHLLQPINEYILNIFDIKLNLFFTAIDKSSHLSDNK